MSGGGWTLRGFRALGMAWSAWGYVVERTRPSLSLITPATYTISVQGHLDTTWSDRLGGMRITACGTGRHAVTVLVGQLADQAALHGVLNALYELGLPLISVDYHSPPERRDHL
jgi:hypothetical protein